MNNITIETIKLVSDLKPNEECSMEVSKDNKYIIRLKKDEKFRYIGSKYSVERDMQSFLKDIGRIDDSTILIVFGLGSGEHIRYLLSNLSSTNKVIVVEPSAIIIREVLKLNYCKDILEDERVVLCYLDNKLKKYLNHLIDGYRVNNVEIIAFSNYSLIFEKQYQFLLKVFNDMKDLKEMGRNTLNEFSELFFKNFINNITCLDDFYIINSFKNIYKNKPAVIVSAGPSLDKNINFLKRVQNNFIIICGPRTFGTLIELGIRPDFICAVDPQEYTYNLMEKYIDSDVPLVFMDIANNKLVKEYRGEKILVANQGMESYIEDIIDTPIDSLLQGGSVAHFCMGLAVYLGCNTIIFIGQDLAYTYEKIQSEYTFFDDVDEKKIFFINNREVWKKESILVEDVYGNNIMTSKLLNIYKEEFEDLISNLNNIKIVNASEGAYIKGAEVMNFKRALDLYNNNLTKLNISFIENAVKVNVNTILNGITNVVRYLKLIQEKSCLGIKYSIEMKMFYNGECSINIEEVMKELDKIELIFMDIEKIGLLAYLLGPSIEKVLTDPKYKIIGNEMQKDLGLKISEKSRVLYKSLYKCTTNALNNIYDIIYFVSEFEI